MTEERIQWGKLTLEEKNMLVATRCMDWHPTPCTDEHEVLYDSGDMFCRHCGVSDHINSFEHGEPLPPRYSENMDAAWLVLQKIVARHKPTHPRERLDPVFEALCDALFAEEWGSAFAEIYPALEIVPFVAKWTPATICLAALKAVGCVFAEGEQV